MSNLQINHLDRVPNKDGMRTEVHWHRVEPDSVGRRLDNYLVALFKGVPKSHIYRIIRSGEVRIDGSRVKPSRRLQLGETVRVPPVSMRRPPMPLKISTKSRTQLENCVLYEDEALLVLDKPSGFSVHAGSRCNFGLAEMLQQMRDATLQPAHRLDRNTSGCLIFAKQRKCLLALHRAFKEHQIKKTYLALVPNSGVKFPATVQAPLTVSHHQQGSWVVVDQAQGRSAETHFDKIEQINDWVLLKVQPLSGRMHQIRVHAAHLGCPIAGDNRYGDFAANRMLEQRGLKRLFLHASQIEFEYEGHCFDFAAPLPEALVKVMDSFR